MESKITEFLTPKQKLFCDEYLIDRNATAAALRAGYSKETALSGYLMKMPKLRLYIDEQAEHIAGEMQVSHAQVLRELCKIAFGNMSNYFAADGSMKPMNALTEDDKAALWNMSGENGSVVKIKMYNKLAALEKIAKHINFYGVQDDEPKTIYKWVTTADIEHDDTFDDEALQNEILELERKAKVQEEFEGREGSGNDVFENTEEYRRVEEETQESRGENQDESAAEIQIPGVNEAFENTEEYRRAQGPLSRDPAETGVGKTESRGEMMGEIVVEEFENTEEYRSVDGDFTDLGNDSTDVIGVDSTDLVNGSTDLEAVEPELVVNVAANVMRPNVPGLSGRLISPEERAERKKQANYWMKQAELRR